MALLMLMNSMDMNNGAKVDAGWNAMILHLLGGICCPSDK